MLIRIQQPSGAPISVSLGPEHKVSAPFADVALDQRLRRLWRLTSRSYAMRYALDPTGEISLQEAQVFTKAPPGDQSTAEAAQAGEKSEEDVGQRFIDALLRHQAVAPAVTPEDAKDAASLFREALEHQAMPAPGRRDAPASEAARRFRAMLESLVERHRARSRRGEGSCAY